MFVVFVVVEGGIDNVRNGALRKKKGRKKRSATNFISCNGITSSD